MTHSRLFVVERGGGGGFGGGGGGLHALGLGRSL